MAITRSFPLTPSLYFLGKVPALGRVPWPGIERRYSSYLPVADFRNFAESSVNSILTSLKMESTNSWKETKNTSKAPVDIGVDFLAEILEPLPIENSLEVPERDDAVRRLNCREKRGRVVVDVVENLGKFSFLLSTIKRNISFKNIK